MAPWIHLIHHRNCISIDSAVFAQLMLGSLYTLQWIAHFPFKIAPLHGGSKPQSNAWFIGPTRVHIPNDTSIGSAVFAGLTIVTEHAIPSVANGRIYVVLWCGKINTVNSQYAPVSCQFTVWQNIWWKRELTFWHCTLFLTTLVDQVKRSVVCVRVCVCEDSNFWTTWRVIWRASSPRHCLGQLRRSRSQVKVQGHWRKILVKRSVRPRARAF